MRPEPFDQIIHSLRSELLAGKTVDRGEWQSLRDDRPQMKVLEAYQVSFQTEVPGHMEEWQDIVESNLPWAEDHFQERVSGLPLNPGEEYKNWPWYEQGVEEHKKPDKFSHTYMERFWPQRAGRSPANSRHRGIRFQYGDLATLIEILHHRPYTRQAYLPIWFPEDLAASWEGERVPCTLGYHFQMRPTPTGDVLDMFYPMRSCDYYRYLRDDVYMAGRLLQWVVSEYERRRISVEVIIPGTLTMHIANLHIFAEEKDRLLEEHQKEMDRRLSDAF